MLFTALMAAPMASSTADVAAGDTETVLAGGSWSFHLDPGSQAIGGRGPSWG